MLPWKGGQSSLMRFQMVELDTQASPDRFERQTTTPTVMTPNVVVLNSLVNRDVSLFELVS